MTASSTTLAVSSCYGSSSSIQFLSTLTATGALTIQGIFQSATTLSMYAPLIQIVYQSSDMPGAMSATSTAALPTSSQLTLPSNSPTTSPQPSVINTTSNNNAWWLALAIGIPAIILFCFFVCWLRYHKKRDQNKGPMQLMYLAAQKTPQNFAQEYYIPRNLLELPADKPTQEIAGNVITEMPVEPHR
jgi:hypothetical protein